MTSMPMLQQLELGVGGQVSEPAAPCSSASLSQCLCLCGIVFVTVEPTTNSATGRSLFCSFHPLFLLPLVLFSSSWSQAVKGLDFSAPVFCSLILLCFPLPRHCSHILFFSNSIEYLFLLQVEGTMIGGMAASGGGTPAPPRRAGQVRNQSIVGS